MTATLTLPGLKAITLPYNPNGISWSYRLNKQVFDTYGGRVTQILSVKTDTVTLQGEVGTRARLLDLFEKLKNLESTQILNQQSAVLSIPLSFAEDNGQWTNDNGISMNVWFRTMNVSMDATTVTYPYQLNFEVEDHNYGVLTQKVQSLIIDGFTKPGAANFSYDHMGITGTLNLSDLIG